jgi:hypothetical protein
MDTAVSAATSITPDVVVYTLSDIANRMPFGETHASPDRRAERRDP